MGGPPRGVGNFIVGVVGPGLGVPDYPVGRPGGSHPTGLSGASPSGDPPNRKVNPSDCPGGGPYRAPRGDPYGKRKRPSPRAPSVDPRGVHLDDPSGDHPGVVHPGGAFPRGGSSGSVVLVSHRQGYTPRDNSGILRVRSFTRVGFPQRIHASLTRVAPGKKVSRGDLARLLVFGTRRVRPRRTGTTVSLGYNGAISLRKDGSPVGSKVFGPVWLEARWGGYSRVAAVALFIL